MQVPVKGKSVGYAARGGRHGRLSLDRFVVGADFSLLAGLRPNVSLNSLHRV
jgi:hypothetical protein